MERWIRCEGLVNRLAAKLGLSTPPRPPKAPSLRDYLAKRAAA